MNTNTFNNIKKFSQHTFAICAFKENPYLEKCIISILKQTISSNIIICTSTPNNYINEIATKYNIPLFINGLNMVGMIKDRNFALECCKTKFVTICDQDDAFMEKYLESILPLLSNEKYNKHLLYVHTGYFEIDDNDQIHRSFTVFIKRVLLLFSKIKFLQKYRFFKKAAICFGDPICDPSCTYNLDNMGTEFYNSNFQAVFDWDLRYKCAIKEGSVYYVSRKVFCHRIIKKGQATSANLKTGIKQKEDLMMFEKMWPHFIAKILFYFYSKGYKIYK